MLAATPRSAAATQARAHAALAPGNSSVTATGPKTFTGPKMYDPATNKPFPNASTVTVSQGSSLVNQLVQVSWTSFTPSSPNNSPGPFYTNNATYYGVMVTECQGSAPASMDHCYLADNHGLPAAFGHGRAFPTPSTRSPRRPAPARPTSTSRPAWRTPSWAATSTTRARW